MVVIVCVAFMFGWQAKQYFDDKEYNSARDKAISFLINAEEGNFDESYNLLSTDLQDSLTLEQFKAEIGIIDDESTQFGVIQTYKSGNTYLINQDIVNENGETQRVLVLSVDKAGGSYAVTSYIFN